MKDHADIVVIGGGAAGIGALRTLADAGRDVLLLEAQDRLGGRAHTVHVAGLPIDLGAGWLHSAPKNPWVAIAEAGGFAVYRSPPLWDEQWRELGLSRTEQAGLWEVFVACMAAMAVFKSPWGRSPVVFSSILVNRRTWPSGAVIPGPSVPLNANSEV
ncbi:MAG: FAD-dependent oxidoreductase, partial [Proteobacteria bacterium]|nr:FAD-dependent oxidoreductase [Pseudomonadota bacterium]